MLTLHLIALSVWPIVIVCLFQKSFVLFISMLQKVLDVEMIYNLRKTVWLDKPCHAAGSVGVCEPNIGLEGSKYKIPTLP